MVSLIIALIVAIGIGVYFGFYEESICFGFFMGLAGTFVTVVIVCFIGTFNTNIAKVDEYDIYHAGSSIYYLNETQEMKEIEGSYEVKVGDDVDKAVVRIKHYDETYFITLTKKEIVIPSKAVKE